MQKIWLNMNQSFSFKTPKRSKVMRKSKKNDETVSMLDFLSRLGIQYQSMITLKIRSCIVLGINMLLILDLYRYYKKYWL